MAPEPPASTRRGSQPTRPNESDFITRLHTDALDTPTSLHGRLGVSRSNKTRVNADSSSSDSDFAPSGKRGHRPQHSRSMSNPFPSLFTSGRRQNSASRPTVDFEGADDTDIVLNPQHDKTHRRGSPARSKDFATGNCMTCASLVRWPKELKVFKCSICTTINDLSPFGMEGQGTSKRPPNTNYGAASARPTAAGSSPEKTHNYRPVHITSHHTAQPISLERTKRLVQTCLASYISRRLHGQSTETISEHSEAQRGQADLLHPDLPVRHRGRNESVGEGKAATGVTVRTVGKEGIDEEAFLDQNSLNIRTSPMAPRSYSSSNAERPDFRNPFTQDQPKTHQRNRSTSQANEPKRIFKLLEDYIIDCFSSFECVNSSFLTHNLRHSQRSKPTGDSILQKPLPPKESGSRLQAKNVTRDMQPGNLNAPVFELDPKLLLLGDVAENGLWWTGRQGDEISKKTPPNNEVIASKSHMLTKSPQLNWGEIQEWYSLVNNAAENWFKVFQEMSEGRNISIVEQDLQAFERDLLKGQVHTQRVLLKAIEILLKRPGRPLTDPNDLRFLLIIMENPLLHSENESFHGLLQPERDQLAATKTMRSGPVPDAGLLSGQHSGIIKRVIGLLSNSPTDCHNQMINWLARYPSSRFIKIKEFVSGFLTYRMIRQGEKKQGLQTVDVTDGLIPQMQAGHSSAYLHDALGGSRVSKKPKEPVKNISYAEDWQIKAASRVLALIFSANNLSSRRGDDTAASLPSRDGIQTGGHFLPPSDFYTSMVDYIDLVADFEAWESKRRKFCFCQYPFLMSIWAKTKILEHDARRQMQSKARDAFFDSIMTRRNINQFLVLDVRRDCLVDDSLTAVSEVIGSGGEDLKKGLRISFRGEEGIDAGGLRKEWFLLLIREVFNPDHGMFIYDEDSQYCYFNPNSIEPSDQYFLVGVVMGLAIYNSTILDVALPPFTFRKLLASVPVPPGAASTQPRPVMKYTLDDLAEYRPRLAHGLRQLLNFEGNVEETFCLDFVAETERYDLKVQVPLCPGGESKPVTSSNRREYVDLYVNHILDIAVRRQFEPFKRGFYTVCGGNAFSLFRAEEIELLVRGSDEALDITSLRAVATYDNWDNKQPDGAEPVVAWFWDSFEKASPVDQRKVLTFITGSDRIPAMGATSLTIKISCLGDDCGRYPIARTCFNMLSLWRYQSRERLESMLWRAVHESEGFGLR